MPQSFYQRTFNPDCDAKVRPLLLQGMSSRQIGRLLKVNSASAYEWVRGTWRQMWRDLGKDEAIVRALCEHPSLVGLQQPTVNLYAAEVVRELAKSVGFARVKITDAMATDIYWWAVDLRRRQRMARHWTT